MCRGQEAAMTRAPSIPEERCPGRSMQDIVTSDGEPVPAALREERWRDPGEVDVPVTRYTSRAFHDEEMRRLWPSVWQMACLEQQIPSVGDHVLYDIGDTSLIVTRVGP